MVEPRDGLAHRSVLGVEWAAVQPFAPVSDVAHLDYQIVESGLPGQFVQVFLNCIVIVVVSEPTRSARCDLLDGEPIHHNPGTHQAGFDQVLDGGSIELSFCHDFAYVRLVRIPGYPSGLFRDIPG